MVNGEMSRNVDDSVGVLNQAGRQMKLAVPRAKYIGTENEVMNSFVSLKVYIYTKIGWVWAWITVLQCLTENILRYPHIDKMPL